MTVKEKLIQMVYQCALSEQDAAAIVEYAIPHLEAIPQSHRFDWNGPADGYPEQLYPILFANLCPKAVEWLEKNHPKYFQIAIFKQSAG